MITPTVQNPAVTHTPPRAAATARVTAVWRAARAPAASSDAVWVPASSAALVLVVGAAGLAMGEPLLFAALGPTALVMAGSPGHSTARFHNVVLGHLVGLACAWAALLLLGVDDHALGVLRAAGAVPVGRVWASAFAVALTAVVQPSLRAYHPPAAATALLLTTGAVRAGWQASLHLMVGVLVVALAGRWLQRLRLDGLRGDAVEG